MNRLIVFIALLFALTISARAQDNALTGFQIDSNKPVKIEADALEIQDSQKTGVFSGNVLVRQDDMTMRTSRLIVHYKGSAADAASGARDAASAEQKISKLEMRGKVVIKSKDQEATGEWADYDVASRQIKLGGGVILSQGKNVLRGETLLVDLNSGKSLLNNKTKKGSGRVQGLFIPSQAKKPASN